MLVATTAADSFRRQCPLFYKETVIRSVPMHPPFLYKPQHVSHEEQVMLKSLAPLVVSCVAFAALALTTAVPAGAADLVNAKLAACSKVGTSVGDVNSCGKMWKIKSGNASV